MTALQDSRPEVVVMHFLVALAEKGRRQIGLHTNHAARTTAELIAVHEWLNTDAARSLEPEVVPGLRELFRFDSHSRFFALSEMFLNIAEHFPAVMSIPTPNPTTRGSLFRIGLDPRVARAMLATLGCHRRLALVRGMADAYCGVPHEQAA